VTILCYHSVDPDWPSPLAVPPAEFDAQCAWLGKRSTVVSLEDAITRLDPKGRLPSGTAAITFDDGYAGLAPHAAPILARHALPATVFVVAETLTPKGRPVDWASPPPPSGTLSSDQILEMQDAGVSFGSHSYSHHDLTSLTEAECERDLRDSRELLEGILGRPVPFLAYPGGRHNTAVRRAASRAGYTHGFTLPDAREQPGPFAIPRVGIYPGNGSLALRVKSTRWYLSLRSSQAFPALRGAARRITRSGPPHD
jgi:peptidoglycan/xylan/chitin deacetylase (PgdA/CDA1 family)